MSFYVVSESKTHIEPANEDLVTEYATPEAAGAAIVQGDHGDYGTRYVLKVETEPVLEYSRSWNMVRKDS